MQARPPKSPPPHSVLALSRVSRELEYARMNLSEKVRDECGVKEGECGFEDADPTVE